MAKIGDFIGNYQLLEELAGGSFGTVYRGTHAVLTTRIVAVKLLHTHLRDPKEREAFFQEARILETLNHPHILHLFDVGIQDHTPYLVTAYAPGGSLRDYLKRQSGKPLSMQEALSFLTQIVQALDCAHQQNIIHRDLKPENLLLDEQGRLLLADFGISTLLGSRSFQQTSLSGTPAYMAPEQFRGEVSRESDQYALGCIAYELLTGQRPFVAPDALALGFKHLTEPVISPRQYNAELPEQVEQAIIRALSKERKQRFPDILSFLAALQLPPKTSQQWLEEGNALGNLQRYEEAVRAYEEAIYLDPISANAYHNKGVALRGLQRHEEAIEAYDEAIRLNPTDADAYHNKGYDLDELGRYEEAIEAYEQAIHLNPTDASAYYNKGIALRNLQRYEEAIEAYDEAIRLNPGDANAYYNKGYDLDELQLYEEAVEAYNEAIRLNPDNANAYYNKGIALRHLKRYEEADQAFKKAQESERS